MKRIICLLSILILLTTGEAFAQRKTKYIPVSVEKADKILAKKNVIVLDVRTPEEIAEGSIPGAVNYNFNNPDFKQQLASLDKSKPYLVYCRSGKRSGKTIELMKTMGFRKLYEIKAGFPAYAAFKASHEN